MRGAFPTSRISRRTVLFQSGTTVVALTASATALATEAPRREGEPSNELRALINAHKTAYAAFNKAVHETGGNSRDYDEASREEERALISICAFPVATQGDRFAKARYLLEIEARGELDLPEHMQALLHSTMWTV
ncbi:MAG: hypothetical protein EOS54_14145 [Mesorhizobium sp.]|nr:hypothetical protein EJ073_30215 [Mesorhizobium sp. M4B.F.Ca.ET.058.02.1.1]RVC46234.1 hypothetical protein EN781_06505 [Mesorhizobium sp. M4A.F.Ca.ET.090.04.2.1]RVD70740.1 hypothetical protein EN751_19115 [Mesorhizobium sp. M4A.F.Ca.ET.029.04.2.1]RWC52919.1 MAG: hypothetical protein EOS54_14145 [Mesorhizobium sp.]RWD16488.1 MAG: hypothetical protein EOS74_05305 [Mesorhizobium sp.]